jgi:hypothetical protein
VLEAFWKEKSPGGKPPGFTELMGGENFLGTFMILRSAFSRSFLKGDKKKQHRE